jgi:hypothetical protein
VIRWFLGDSPLSNLIKSSGRVYEELLLERGLYPGVETTDTPDGPDVLDGGGGVGTHSAVQNLFTGQGGTLSESEGEYVCRMG